MLPAALLRRTVYAFKLLATLPIVVSHPVGGRTISLGVLREFLPQLAAERM